MHILNVNYSIWEMYRPLKLSLKKKMQICISFPTLIVFFFLSGEILGLLGPDGAGKSSSIRMIAGITKPTAGQVAKRKAVSISTKIL